MGGQAVPRSVPPSWLSALRAQRDDRVAGRLGPEPVFDGGVGITAERFRPALAVAASLDMPPSEGKPTGPRRKVEGGRPSDRTAGLPPSRVGWPQDPTPTTVAAGKLSSARIIVLVRKGFEQVGRGLPQSQLTVDRRRQANARPAASLWTAAPGRVQRGAIDLGAALSPVAALVGAAPTTVQSWSKRVNQLWWKG